MGEVLLRHATVEKEVSGGAVVRDARVGEL